MTIGFDRDLYVLPFDHRGSFETKMFGWEGPLTAEQTAQIAAAKQVIYDGFKGAVVAGVPKEKAGILVDESWSSFGSASLSSSRMIRWASTLPSSTPHWSNESMCQMVPCVKTLCSYSATNLPSADGVR